MLPHDTLPHRLYKEQSVMHRNRHGDTYLSSCLTIAYSVNHKHHDSRTRLASVMEHQLASGNSFSSRSPPFHALALHP